MMDFLTGYIAGAGTIAILWAILGWRSLAHAMRLDAEVQNLD